MNILRIRHVAALLFMVLLFNAVAINVLAYMQDSTSDVVNTFIFESDEAPPAPPDPPQPPEPPQPTPDEEPPEPTPDEQPPTPDEQPPTPDEVTVELTVQKNVDNKAKEPITAEGFEFILKDINSGDSFTETTNKKGIAKFRLKFTAEDVGKTYEFTLSEIDSGKEGVIYSTKIYNVKMAVELNEDNEIAVRIYSDETEISGDFRFEFINIYEPAPGPTGDFGSILFYVLMALISISGVVLLVYTKKKVI